MNKLIYRKLALDILSFFIVASISITLIVWVIQAVNFLDIVSEDGHSLKVYFSYTILNLPRIFSRILIFMFFISCIYTVNLGLLSSILKCNFFVFLESEGLTNRTF